MTVPPPPQGSQQSPLDQTGAAIAGYGCMTTGVCGAIPAQGSQPGFQAGL
jgi:hypothetical protein